MSEPRRMRPRCRGRRPSRPALRTGTSADGERTSEPGCFACARNDEVFSRRIGVRVLRTTTTPSKMLPSRGKSAGRRSAERRIHPLSAHRPRCCHLKALWARKRPDVGGRSPSGAPTAALAKATERFDSAQATLRASGRTQALPAPPIALKRSTPRPGRSAEGTMPGPPRRGLRSPRGGTALAPPQGSSREAPRE